MELRQVRYLVALAENLKCQADKQTPACFPASRPSLSVTISSIFPRAYVQENFAVIHEFQEVCGNASARCSSSTEHGHRLRRSVLASDISMARSLEAAFDQRSVLHRRNSKDRLTTFCSIGNSWQSDHPKRNCGELWQRTRHCAFGVCG